MCLCEQRRKEGRLHDRWTHVAAQNNQLLQLLFSLVWGVLVRTVDRNCPSREESKISINNSTSEAPAMVPIAKISYISSS